MAKDVHEQTLYSLQPPSKTKIHVLVAWHVGYSTFLHDFIKLMSR